jgi:hypothetical protein
MTFARQYTPRRKKFLFAGCWYQCHQHFACNWGTPQTALIVSLGAAFVPQTDYG